MPARAREPCTFPITSNGARLWCERAHQRGRAEADAGEYHIIAIIARNHRRHTRVRSASPRCFLKNSCSCARRPERRTAPRASQPAPGGRGWRARHAATRADAPRGGGVIHVAPGGTGGAPASPRRGLARANSGALGDRGAAARGPPVRDVGRRRLDARGRARRGGVDADARRVSRATLGVGDEAQAVRS